MEGLTKLKLATISSGKLEQQIENKLADLQDDLLLRELDGTWTMTATVKFTVKEYLADPVIEWSVKLAVPGEKGAGVGYRRKDGLDVYVQAPEQMSITDIDGVVDIRKGGQVNE